MNTNYISSLPNPGLHVTPEIHHNLDITTLFNQRRLTRDAFEKVGFLLFHEYHPAGDDSRSERPIPDTRIIDGVVRDISGTQLMHKDGDGGRHVLQLRYDGQSGKRNCDTIVATDQEKLFELFIAFFRDNYENLLCHSMVPKPVEDLIEIIQQKGVQAVAEHPARESFDGKNWRSYLFHGFGISVISNPILEVFYKDAAARGLIYAHRWQKGQTLIINNNNMLHARLMRDPSDGPFDPALAQRTFYAWDDEELRVLPPKV